MRQPYVSDSLWEIIKPILPHEKNRHHQSVGRRPIDSRLCLEVIIFILKTGVPFSCIPPWHDMPGGITAWRRLRDWQKKGIWKKLFETMLTHLRAAGKLDLSRAIVDSSSIRAPGGGRKTGPSPTDRRKMGTKHHLIVDKNGIPLAVEITGANRHDVTQIIKLVEDIPEIKGKVGHPLYKPKIVQGDRGYDSEPKRKTLKKMGIKPELAKRRMPHGSGLGKTRWVVERSIAWLNDFRRLQIRYEKTVPIHKAFVFLACTIIAFRKLGI